MTGHDSHVGHQGYSPRQVLKDFCVACLDLSGDLAAAVDDMDRDTFERAWDRARRKSRTGLTDMSAAEGPLLDVLAAVQRQFARAIPTYPVALLAAATSTETP